MGASKALARLSLAKDRIMLFGSLVCILPTDSAQLVMSSDEASNIELPDIYTSCHVVGIGNNDVAIIDGAFGATIR